MLDRAAGYMYIGSAYKYILAGHTMVVAVTSTKGGTGKTSTVCNTAASLGLSGYRVLTVDMDPQRSLSRWYGVTQGTALPEVLKGESGLKEAVYTSEEFGFDLIPSSRQLREQQSTLSRLERPLHRLVHEHYDLCLIDTPPSISRFSGAAVEMSAGTVIPIEASMAAMDTLGDSLDMVDQLGGTVLGVLVCRVDQRTSNDISVQPHLREQYGDLIFDQVIRESVAVRDSHADRVPTVVGKPGNNASADYKDFALKLKARIDHAEQETV
jgi:chromosome partitioning protein